MASPSRAFSTFAPGIAPELDCIARHFARMCYGVSGSDKTRELGHLDREAARSEVRRSHDSVAAAAHRDIDFLGRAVLYARCDADRDDHLPFGRCIHECFFSSSESPLPRALPRARCAEGRSRPVLVLVSQLPVTDCCDPTGHVGAEGHRPRVSSDKDDTACDSR
jgi:hypothetical protein